MSRPLRIEFKGALYLITSRGNAKQDIYMNGEDREVFLDILGNTISRMGWICHGYCLMINHYHLIIETPEANLSKGMRLLNGVYTQTFNRRHDGAGHLFQGRFKSILVEKKAYLKELARYVALTPVLANITEKAEDYPWSSYRSTAGLDAREKWLNVDPILSCFDRSKKLARTLYMEFVEEGLKLRMDLEKEIRHQVFLGSAEFIAELQENYSFGKDLSEIPWGQKKNPMKTFEYFDVEYSNRKEAMARAYLSGQFTLKEVGNHFGVHYSTVSKAVKEFEKK